MFHYKDSSRAVVKAFFACLVIAVAMAPQLRADAWTQEQGHGQIIFGASFFETAREYEADGNVARFSYQGSFRQFQLNPYIEYGLTSRTTLVVNAFAPFLKFENQYGSQTSAGMGDIETAVRHRLNSTESPMPVSVQFTVLFPTYPADRQPPPGNHQVDLESKLMIGRGVHIAKRTAFWSMGGAYRFRSGAPADQWRSDATLGLDLTHRFTVMTQFFGITGLRNGSPLVVGGNPNAQSDFDLYKGQFSLVTRLGPHTRFQLGWNDTIAGRNTGRGQTVLVALWQDF
jgi:hypothetical protein